MELFEAIEKRKSYRGRFTRQPVSREDLKKIVSAGLAAPSGKNAQTTRFVIIDDPEIVSKIAALHEKNLAVRTAKAFIACIIDKDPEPIYRSHSFQVEDCAAAVENMLLAAAALGLATVWIDGWLRIESYAEKIASFIDLPDTKVVRVLLPIGYPAEDYPQPPKMAFEKRVSFNRFSKELVS